MNNLFYPKLALSNIKKNGKIYIPYILASVFVVAMFYIMSSLSQNPSLQEISGGESLAEIFQFGTVIIGFFSTLILFYANNFLIKQRKKELGLYNILGMEKKHLARMLLVEMIFISLFSIILGILSGALLSNLLYLVLLKIIGFSVAFSLSLSISSIIKTILLFFVVFLFILFFNMLKVRSTNAIDLLKGGQHGEREPRTKWFLALLGFTLLGAGYSLALIVESPLEALSTFFIAVLLVIIGTYCLFIAGSILILKILRKNKKIYYNSQNFTVISGMIYRMKQHATGLASICILSTMVLVTISTTVSLYVGKEDILNNRFPQEIRMTNQDPTEENMVLFENILEEELENYGLVAENKVSYRIETAFVKGANGSFQETKDFSGDNLTSLAFMTENDFREITGEYFSLDENEVLIYSKENYPHETIELNEETLNVMAKLEVNEQFKAVLTSVVITDAMILVVKDMNVVDDIFQNTLASYEINMDVSGNEELIPEFISALRGQTSQEESLSITIKSRQEMDESFLGTYGSILFLGLFLGALFLMATGLIIYYKQISEGYEDKERFNIMQKVGMSKEEVKQTIRTQTLMVFFLPLIMAMIHIAFAFRVMTKLLSLFAMTNIGLFFICTVLTILIFAVIYGILYQLTAKAYFKIVS